MVAVAVLQAKLHVIEDELRRAAQFVGPCDQRVGDDDARLPQQPLRDPRVVVLLLRIEFDAGHMQAAVRVATDRQLRPVDGQFLQAQVEERQRGPRYDQIDARQVEHRLGGSIVAVADLQAAHRQPRIPSLPAGVDGRNRHG